MSDGNGTAFDSPKYKAIEAVIRSTDGKAAMERAFQNKQPPLGAVDQLLTAIIVDYADNAARQIAGKIVGAYMYERGRNHVGQATNPAGSTAGKGALFE